MKYSPENGAEDTVKCRIEETFPKEYLKSLKFAQVFGQGSSSKVTYYLQNLNKGQNFGRLILNYLDTARRIRLDTIEKN